MQQRTTSVNGVASTGPNNEAQWIDPSIVEGWKKWHPFLVDFFHPITVKMAAVAEFKPGMQVLDLASGSGEPAISIATIVGDDGEVIATDIGPEMIEVAKAHSLDHGLTNMQFKVLDAHDLPFEDDTFDRVTCRQGIMYFTDYMHTLKEIFRVLKPSGMVVLTATGPLDQPFFSCTVGVIQRYVELPKPEGVDKPPEKKLSDRGVLIDAMRKAGFSSISEQHISPILRWPGSVQEFRLWFFDVAAPYKRLIDELEEVQRESVYQEIEYNLSEFATDAALNIPFACVLAAGKCA